MDATIVFLEQRNNPISLLVRFTKHRQLARQVGDSRALSIVEKEVMAPFTYVGLALGASPGGRIRFRSLEFTDINRPAPVDGLLASQTLRFGDLDFMADRLGQLRLSEENAASPHILVDILSRIFLVFSPSVGAKQFWVNLDGMACCCAYRQCRSSAYLGGVYVILIVRARQTSHKGQQSLTKLNAMQAAYI